MAFFYFKFIGLLDIDIVIVTSTLSDCRACNDGFDFVQYWAHFYKNELRRMDRRHGVDLRVNGFAIDCSSVFSWPFLSLDDCLTVGFKWSSVRFDITFQLATWNLVADRLFPKLSRRLADSESFGKVDFGFSSSVPSRSVTSRTEWGNGIPLPLLIPPLLGNEHQDEEGARRRPLVDESFIVEEANTVDRSGWIGR